MEGIITIRTKVVWEAIIVGDILPIYIQTEYAPVRAEGPPVRDTYALHYSDYLKNKGE